MTSTQISQVPTQRYLRRSERDWRKLIACYRKSGLSQTAFCKREGVPLASFNNWHRRLRETVATSDLTLPPTASFVELGTLQPEPVAAMTLVRLDLGNGVVLEVSRR